MTGGIEHMAFGTQNIIVKSSGYHRNFEELKARKDPDAIKAVAKEMEALFAYKEMRKISEISSGDKGFGRDAYMSMFDVKLARLFAERGLGLQDMLVKALNEDNAFWIKEISWNCR